MSRAAHRIFALLLAFSLLMAQGLVVCAAEEDEPPLGHSVVYSQNELYAWLSDNGASGGTVALGCSVTIEKNLLYYGEDVTIDAASYGLVFDGGFLAAEPGESLHITGEGVDVPVVEAKSLGKLWTGDWSFYLRKLSITATGRDGAGGTALRISSSGGGSHYDDLYEIAPQQIRSYGTGAVGLELLAPFNANCFDIAAEGEGSAAVLAREGGVLSFCKLTATGTDAVCATGTDLVLDTCQAEPACDSADILAYSRTAAPAHLIVKQGDSARNVRSAIERTLLPLTGGDGRPAITELTVLWNTEKYTAIDTAAAGRTTVMGELGFPRYVPVYGPYWFTGFLPVDTQPILIVDVWDVDVPCIFNVNPRMEDGRVQLHLWSSDRWGREDCVLWRSDDGGETWYDRTGDSTFTEGTSGLSIRCPPAEDGSMYQVEVPGFGESNVVEFSYAYGRFSSDKGGDRTGVDRIIGTKPGSGSSGGGKDKDDENSGEGDSGKDDDKAAGDDNSNNNDHSSGGTDGDGGDGENTVPPSGPVDTNDEGSGPTSDTAGTGNIDAGQDQGFSRDQSGGTSVPDSIRGTRDHAGASADLNETASGEKSPETVPAALESEALRGAPAVPVLRRRDVEHAGTGAADMPAAQEIPAPEILAAVSSAEVAVTAHIPAAEAPVPAQGNTMNGAIAGTAGVLCLSSGGYFWLRAKRGRRL